MKLKSTNQPIEMKKRHSRSKENHITLRMLIEVSLNVEKPNSYKSLQQNLQVQLMILFFLITRYLVSLLGIGFLNCILFGEMDVYLHTAVILSSGTFNSFFIEITKKCKHFLKK